MTGVQTCALPIYANQNDLALLDKQLEEKMSLEERKSAREAIDEILSDNITADDIMLDEAKVVDDYIVSDTKRDILKIVVINRYEDSAPSIGFVKNFGLKKGAIGSSIAHDSHNIISVGVDDIDICRAVNIIIKNKGGLSA